MIRSYRASHDLIAVSAALSETALNTEQTLDTALLCAIGDIPNLEVRTESNENEATGKEEPDTLYRLGATASWSPTFDKAQPQHFAFLCAYGLGQCVSCAAGAGYLHTITPLTGDLDWSRSNPTFTFSARYGKTVLKRRFASGCVDSLTATFSRDSWVKLSGSVKGTGKYEDNVVEETLSASASASSLTLAAKGVQGDDANERLQNVQRVRAELAPGIWTDVAVTGVSDATPAEIAITPPGSETGTVNYRVLYIPVETGWMAFPPRISETPLRVAQMTLTLGGVWDGTAFKGGRPVQAALKELSWTFNNAMEVTFVPGAGGDFASRAIRGGRTQKISLSRDFQETVFQRHLIAGDTMGIHILAEGAAYDGEHKYQVELIFPKVGFLAAPISADGKRLSEAGDLQVLEDDVYGSVIVRVQNLQSGYAA